MSELRGNSVPATQNAGAPVTAVDAPQGDAAHDRMALPAAGETENLVNRTHDRLLAMLSHELRAPLTPVLMSVQAIESDPGLSSEIRSEITLIRRNIEQEIQMIDDLLDLAILVSGRVVLQFKPIELNETLRHVCESCVPQFLQKKLRLSLELDEEVGKVEADPARLHQTFWYVLTNAIKFTPRDGSILVRTRCPSAGVYQVHIGDTGIGIAPDAQPRIFDPFTQGSDQIAREFGGLGLGLAIAKALTELHHGSIAAGSEGEGRGTTITIILPASP